MYFLKWTVITPWKVAQNVCAHSIRQKREDFHRERCYSGYDTVNSYHPSIEQVGLLPQHATKLHSPDQ